ncbi:MAG: hypothetical protein AAF560_34315 [Acidobacteriota bacterium]
MPTNNVAELPAALLVTPITPATGGNGLAMRAGLLLEALQRDHHVQVWRVPTAGGDEGAGQIVAPLEVDPGWTLAQRAGPQARRRLGRPELCRFATHRAVRELQQAIGGVSFQTTLVFRSYLLPFAMPLERRSGKIGPSDLGLRVVDLDDDETATRQRLAALLRAAGDSQGAQREALEAELFQSFEDQHLSWAHLLLSAQREHSRGLRARFESQRAEDLRVDVLPNAIDTRRVREPEISGQSSNNTQRYK